VYYWVDDGKSYDWSRVDDGRNFFNIEDLIPDIKELYEELYMKVKPIKEHNESILKREEVIRPYRLARELTA
jgi:succinate dehydrogenase/fumarate reductase-like Fe-S protein